jgi:ERCC4-related helicase
MKHPLTPYQVCYLAHDLTRKCAPDDPNRINAPVFDARIDLNPHQLEAALFALESPFASGVLLADEVGLGKTVEAGLLLAQRWAEGKRRLLVVAPASLTRQWADELQDKFHLPATVLTSASSAAGTPTNDDSPWACDGVVICSYHFAAAREASLKKEWWDLVVLDEAHRLRNAYKVGNRIGQTLRDVFANTQKILLTATPLQNSLMELYGLMSVLDGHLFGDAASFKYQYGQKRSDAALKPLADRIAPYCRRTLRRDVAGYIKWTHRKAHLVRFRETPEEKALYDALSDYLAKPHLFAIPKRNRHLMALMLRKLQASSPAALAGTLERLVATLAAEVAEEEMRYRATRVFSDDVDTFPVMLDEWTEEEEPESQRPNTGEQSAVWSAHEEQRVLKSIVSQARGLNRCTKADSLLATLWHAFTLSNAARERAGQQRMQPKAIIFTESRRTQDYLIERLQEVVTEDEIVAFNGTNDGPQAKAIVASWRAARAGTDQVTGNYSADARAALVQHFRSTASVMVATEAAAEGLNLQFCNLVVNYDLPWNPQRIEQRIGRCHRYGQRCDVVVINFLNEANAADQRVYELLDTKCRLFEGVFGASDEILGAIGTDFNFEKRIALIYESCRTPEEIDEGFARLQQELDEQITHARNSATDKLFARFKPEVTDRVRTDAKKRQRRVGEALWGITREVLRGHTTFNDDDRSFILDRLPDRSLDVPLGCYVLPQDEDSTTSHAYRLGHPLAQWVLSQGRAIRPVVKEVLLHESPERVGAESGWCLCCLVTTTGATASEEVLGVCTETVDWRRLMECDSTVGEPCKVPLGVLTVLRNRMNSEVRRRSERTNNQSLKWVAREKAKLQAWARDKEIAIEREIQQVTEKADAAASASRATINEEEVAKKGMESLREEQLARKKVVELTERLLAVRRESGEEQGRMVLAMLKECDVKAEAKDLFLFFWKCAS